MTPKQYFEQIFELDKAIDELRSERESIIATGSKANTMQDAPTYSNQFNSTTENIVMKLFDHMDDVNARVDELIDLKMQISMEIELVKDRRYRTILKEHYICDKSFEQIAVEQPYSYRHATRLHGQALQAFKEVHKKKFRNKETCPTMS